VFILCFELRFGHLLQCIWQCCCCCCCCCCWWWV